MMDKTDKKHYRNTGIARWMHENWPNFVALLFTLVLAYFDYIAQKDIFKDAKMPPEDYIPLACLFAICLEGIPFVGASFLATLTIKVSNRKKDKLQAIIGIGVTVVALSLVWGISWYLRTTMIEANGGEELFKNAEEVFGDVLDGYVSYIADVFMKFSTIITSLLAFLVSWWAQKQSVEMVERDVRRAHNDYLEAQSKFYTAWKQLENARETLWNEVTKYEKRLPTEEVPYTEIPKKTDVFRQTCYKRIQTKLINDLCEIYSSKMKRYKMEVENCLRGFVDELAEYSNIPEVIKNIDIKELINEYDAEVEAAEGECEHRIKWSSKDADKGLKERFLRLIDNSVIIVHSGKGRT